MIPSTGSLRKHCGILQDQLKTKWLKAKSNKQKKNINNHHYTKLLSNSFRAVFNVGAIQYIDTFRTIVNIEFDTTIFTIFSASFLCEFRVSGMSDDFYFSFIFSSSPAPPGIFTAWHSVIHCAPFCVGFHFEIGFQCVQKAKTPKRQPSPVLFCTSLSGLSIQLGMETSWTRTRKTRRLARVFHSSQLALQLAKMYKNWQCRPEKYIMAKKIEKKIFDFDLFVCFLKNKCSTKTIPIKLELTLIILA